jgi:hypothetical protein
VAIAGALLSNPNWVQLVAEGRVRELRKFSKANLDELR